MAHLAVDMLFSYNLLSFRLGSDDSFLSEVYGF